MRYYGQRMRASLAQVGAAAGDNNGLWAPACLDHGADFGFNHSKLSINGIGLKEAVMNWYNRNGTGGASANVHIEGCALERRHPVFRALPYQDAATRCPSGLPKWGLNEN